jgi:hypothetical protein
MHTIYYFQNYLFYMKNILTNPYMFQLCSNFGNSFNIRLPTYVTFDLTLEIVLLQINKIYSYGPLQE